MNDFFIILSLYIEIYSRFKTIIFDEILKFGLNTKK